MYINAKDIKYETTRFISKLCLILTTTLKCLDALFKKRHKIKSM